MNDEIDMVEVDGVYVPKSASQTHASKAPMISTPALNRSSTPPQRPIDEFFAGFDQMMDIVDHIKRRM